MEERRYPLKRDPIGLCDTFIIPHPLKITADYVYDTLDHRIISFITKNRMIKLQVSYSHILCALNIPQKLF